MDKPSVIEHLKELAGQPHHDDSPDSLIGIFQTFRPDGRGLHRAFERLAGGDEFGRRLQRVYDATAHSRRYDAFTDAYFVVRQPPALQAAVARNHAAQLLQGLTSLVGSLESPRLKETVHNQIEIRVLEGLPPKKPKRPEDRCRLHEAVHREVPQLVSEQLIARHESAKQLAEACYFIACDAFLRDYLLWPLFGTHESLDPFRPYFELWRHGVKLRAFSDERLDFYLPTRADGTLIEPGPAASPQPPANPQR